MGKLSIPAAGPVYFDANCVIYSVEKVHPYVGLLAPIWEAAARGQISIITSELTLLETLVGPLRDGNARLENLLRNVLLHVGDSAPPHRSAPAHAGG